MKKINDNVKENLIKLYPFNGRSSNLIENFFIIGYNYPTLHRYLIEESQKGFNNNKSKNIQSFTIDEKPSVLNEISYDVSKVKLPYDEMMTMIYPHDVKIYYLYENYSKDDINCEDKFQKIEFNDNSK